MKCSDEIDERSKDWERRYWLVLRLLFEIVDAVVKNCPALFRIWDAKVVLISTVGPIVGEDDMRVSAHFFGSSSPRLNRKFERGRYAWKIVCSCQPFVSSPMKTPGNDNVSSKVVISAKADSLATKKSMVP